jgi:hypothetical protein
MSDRNRTAGRTASGCIRDIRHCRVLSIYVILRLRNHKRSATTVPVAAEGRYGCNGTGLNPAELVRPATQRLSAVSECYACPVASAY